MVIGQANNVPVFQVTIIIVRIKKATSYGQLYREGVLLPYPKQCVVARMSSF